MRIRDLVALSLAACASPVLPCQNAPVPSELRRSVVDAGPFDNASVREAVVFERVVGAPRAGWLRFVAASYSLPGESRIEVVSMRDGQRHALTAAELERWSGKSAYMTGDSLLLRLVAAPRTRGVAFRTRVLEAGLPPAHAETICGPTDDRTPSNDRRVGRLMPIGCTVWIFGNCLVTAGHCRADGQTVHFNIKPSAPNGTPTPSDVEDQYPVDDATWISENAGEGKDWAVFRAGVNNLGQRPHQRQGASFNVFFGRPRAGTPIRITGCGITVPPNARNQTQQTHSGPHAAARARSSATASTR